MLHSNITEVYMPMPVHTRPRQFTGPTFKLRKNIIEHFPLDKQK